MCEINTWIYPYKNTKVGGTVGPDQFDRLELESRESQEIASKTDWQHFEGQTGF